MTDLLSYEYQSDSCYIKAQETLWDSKIYGFPVITVSNFSVTQKSDIQDFSNHFLSWLKTNKVGLVSARIDSTDLRSSIILETLGFRFIETVLHPTIDLTKFTNYFQDNLSISIAKSENIEEIQNVAERAFNNERLHVDPRLDASIGNIRYANWVASALDHKSQTLLKINDGDNLVAFFIVEAISNQEVYWHLTAVSPNYQGRGFGRRVWLAMLKYHRDSLFQTVSTTITARNIRVLNLYSKFQFKFNSPQMTFHWVADHSL